MRVDELLRYSRAFYPAWDDAYAEELRARCPNAEVVYDLFHVVAKYGREVIDRVRVGYVIDFLDVRVWPVFNVADSCVTVGACCLAWGLSRLEKKSSSSP